MRTAVLFEPEELLFDTLALRSRALYETLTNAGVTVDRTAVTRAHEGVPALVAIAVLSVADRLDETDVELVLRRATDHFRAAISTGLPVFDPGAAHAIAQLAREFSIGVVTRGARVDAQLMLEYAGLEHCVSVIRSIESANAVQQPGVWSDAMTSLRAERGLALVPSGLVAGARAAGLETPSLGGCASWHALAHANGISVDRFFKPQPST